MADEQSSIFNEKATEKLRSPDDLERYVRVTNPSVWVMLAACVILLLGLMAWGVFGSLSTSISSNGVVVNGELLCLVSPDEVSQIKVGDTGFVDNVRVEVDNVAAEPLSAAEVQSLVGSDYLTEALMPGEWGYPVTLSGENSGDLAPGVPHSVNITTERVAPVSLVLG